MNNVKKVVICMCLVMITLGLCVSCGYSQDKPSEEVMKNIIPQLVITHYHLRKSGGFIYSNIIYNVFKITHSFFKKNSDGRDIYCVEITYKISCTFTKPEPNSKPENDSVEGKVEKFSFLKKGDDWYGKKGWDIQ